VRPRPPRRPPPFFWLFRERRPPSVKAYADAALTTGEILDELLLIRALEVEAGQTRNRVTAPHSCPTDHRPMRRITCSRRGLVPSSIGGSWSTLAISLVFADDDAALFGCSLPVIMRNKVD